MSLIKSLLRQQRRSERGAIELGPTLAACAVMLVIIILLHVYATSYIKNSEAAHDAREERIHSIQLASAKIEQLIAQAESATPVVVDAESDGERLVLVVMDDDELLSASLRVPDHSLFTVSGIEGHPGAYRVSAVALNVDGIYATSELLMYESITPDKGVFQAPN